MRTIFFLILILLLVPEYSQAQRANLYVGSVPVENQSPAVREDAFPMALIQVLEKLSGLRDLNLNPEVVDAVSFARSLVISFHYEQVKATDSRERDAPGVDRGQTLLAVRFAETGTNELLQALELPRWRTERQPLKVWLLIDDGFGRQIMPVEYEYLRDPLERAASNRGLSLGWPQADENGSYGVDAQLLWGGYSDQLENEGEADNVLIIAARREGPEWNSRQILNYGGENWSWRNRNINLKDGLTAAINRVVDEIAAVQAISASEQGAWVHRISVGGITSGDDYIRCLQYLESLSVIDEVAVTAADPLAVTMVLVLNTTPEYLQRVLEGDQVLESEGGSGHYVLQ